MNQMLVDILTSQDPLPAWLDGARAWVRVYGRTAGSNRATLVYEPDGDPDAAMCVRIGGNGESVGALRNVSAMPWFADPALPALPDLRARHRGLRPVRYRPGKRCTLKLEGPRPLFVKCVADDRGRAINEDARLLDQAQRAGLLGFSVARPGGWLPGLKLIAQYQVAGSPVVPRLWSDTALAGKLGAANASLIAAPLRPMARFTYADQMRRTAKYARRLEKRVGGVAGLLGELMMRLGNVEPGHADRPIHGAPHAHQWLEADGKIALVDFDRFSLGDPELDVATFVAEADFEDAPGALAGADAYLGAFGARWPLNADLVRAYRIHKHVAKALRVSSAIRPDAAARAHAIIAAATEML
jgi:hypothetical protein